MPPIYFDDPDSFPSEQSAPRPVYWDQWDLDRLESFISSIITARVVLERWLLPPEESHQWGVYAPESSDIDEVLQHAWRLFEDHIDHLLSNPKRHPSDFTRLVKEFLLSGPDDIFSRLQSDQAVDWTESFRWHLLADIRKGIDAIRGEQISTEDARRDEMKSMIEELREDKHFGEAEPPVSDEKRCELIESECVLYWGGIRIDTFTDTEYQLLSMLWRYRERARELDRFLADCGMKFGWGLNTRRLNFDRHKSGIKGKFEGAGFEMPISVRNFKVRAWSHPRKLEKTKAIRKKDMGPA